MNEAALKYTTAGLDAIIGREVTIYYITQHVPKKKTLGLIGVITGYRTGDNRPVIPASSDFVPTEQSAHNAQVAGVDLPKNISVLDIERIMS